ncbi:MAG: ABC transporter ATP-binding protein [Dehalococcoidia bacterium]
MSASDDIVLRTSGLTKRYGKRLAVDALDIDVRRGRAYGFLGPNGSGKTTTIGMILGLVRVDGGSIHLFGSDAAAHRESALRRIGATVEGQSYFPHLSARDNLRLWAKISDVPDKRIDEVIETVGLTSRAQDKARTYSLGMKQRLAVGAAILHDPDLVILDEPTNGLDPAGIREFRQMVHNLRAEGKTVFVSSHILSEVEQMCDDVGIIKLGRLVIQKPVAELRSAASSIELRTTDDVRALALLSGLPWIAAIAREDGQLVASAPPERSVEISRTLAASDIFLHELRPRDSSLEDFFLEVTEDAEHA